MTPTAFALLGFAAWSILLVAMLGGFRVGLVFGGKGAVAGFKPSGEDLDGFGQRLTRAHANCYENLPVAGTVMLYAIATAQTALTDPAAQVLLGARMAQSIVHLVSASRVFVLIRFFFYLVQIAILSWWLLQFLKAA